ncbi:unnamed protein product [Diatraea saccharalis]|uniref:PHTF1/2 N-terminal domain-containing protein n=1 Tax=Diatraea saccharalis TaxID=40085 RepID=A0A9N9QYW1_9NEOP|nr:unnamed protein product [Diatraea saccharalis]
MIISQMVSKKDQLVRQRRMGDDGGTAPNARHLPAPHRRLFITRSSFPKAKPTLGMRRVVWFALVRLVFLPGLHQWWVQQTSPACANFLLALWIMQVLNITLYFMAPTDIVVDVSQLLVSPSGFDVGAKRCTFTNRKHHGNGVSKSTSTSHLSKKTAALLQV